MKSLSILGGNKKMSELKELRERGEFKFNVSPERFKNHEEQFKKGVYLACTGAMNGPLIECSFVSADFKRFGVIMTFKPAPNSFLYFSNYFGNPYEETIKKVHPLLNRDEFTEAKALLKEALTPLPALAYESSYAIILNLWLGIYQKDREETMFTFLKKVVRSSLKEKLSIDSNKWELLCKLNKIKKYSLNPKYKYKIAIDPVSPVFFCEHCGKPTYHKVTPINVILHHIQAGENSEKISFACPGSCTAHIFSNTGKEFFTLKPVTPRI